MTKFKSKIRSFSAGYNHHLNLVRLTAVTPCMKKDDRAIKSRDIAVGSAELTTMVIKKDQTLAVRDRLKRMSRHIAGQADRENRRGRHRIDLAFDDIKNRFKD